ncbi:MAG: autotransporter domain-containing protein, partial [Alphaproteobacteria bacterium]|nr:autotransporter domain-containing protein [Alphaproteobacteria bacterium]
DSFARWTGGIENHGFIAGGEAGIRIGNLTGSGDDVEFSGGLFNDAGAEISALSGTAVAVGGRSFAGGITNKGKIDGSAGGILIEASTFFDGIVNSATGRILGDGVAAVRIAGGSFAGGVENAGLIEGAHGGLLIDGATFAGGMFNATQGSILAHDGDAVFASAAWGGDFENRGAIEGTRRGFAYVGPTFDGDASNSGRIKGASTAFFMSTELFSGSFSNSGEITGGANGVSLVTGHVDGRFLNSGTIRGQTGTGVAIDTQSWGASTHRADIVNTASGVITGGETGFWLRALSVFGDFVNDGEISGGGVNTGIHFDVAEFFGNLTNNGAVEAPSNAVHLQIGTLHGQVTNTGTITATAPNGVAVALDIGNGTTFTNEGGGLIFGDVLLGGPAAYTFLGRDGGVEGDIAGSGNNDRLIVEDGTQYFVDGTLSNLLRFDVNDGGTAVMGGRSVGDANGPGYGATNVGALSVNEGGRLYLDDDTILHVGSFTQSSGGELTYYLVAPTGTPVAGVDFGRVDASGAVSLAGRLSVILDASSFGGTTQTDFTYTDIIRGASFAGEFDDVAVEGSSYFFRLALTYGDNALDLAVTRTPFDVTFCAQHLSQNSQDLGAALEAAFLAGGFTPEQIELFDFLGQLQDVCGGYFDLGGAVLGDIHSITVETAGPWKSAVNDRVNSTGATSCVVAGSAGCLTRFVQNEVGGSAVQSDANDPFAWLRTGVRPEGQFSVWGRILGVQGDNQGRGGASGSDFTVTGGIVGADYVLSPRLIVGAAAQLTNTDVDFKHRRDTADVRSFEVGGYFSYGDADFCVNGNASIIFHDFNTYRFPFEADAQGAYQGRTVSAYAEAGKVFEFDTVRVEPVLALSFAALDTDAYRETGSAGGKLLIVEGASHMSLKSMIGARFAYPLDVLESGRKIVPEARLLWGHEYLDDQAQFRAALSSLPDNPFTVRGQRFSRDSLLAGVGLNVPLSAKAALYADYDLSLSRDQSIQSLSVGARVSW